MEGWLRRERLMSALLLDKTLVVLVSLTVVIGFIILKARNLL